jgi:phenylacetate-CoA ligase
MIKSKNPKIWNAGKLLPALKDRPENYWRKRGERMALGLFKAMSKRVPAYKDYLKKLRFDPDKIKDLDGFKDIPTIDKVSYLRQYPREMLCWDGKFSDSQWVVSTTSGSTGEPFYFPRQEYQDSQYALTAELYLRSNFKIHKQKTLYVVAFPMGAWIGGLFTYEALKIIARRSEYKFSIITPGINKLEVIKSIVNLGDDFDQVIIGSYGPFLKDILDDGIRMGVDWKRYNLKFVFSAEGFSESFRDHVLKVAGQKDPYRTTLNHYGTVDLGTMSYETPLSIFIRRAAVKNPVIYQTLFEQAHTLPTLTQYLPEQFFFEEVNGNLLCSSYSGIPLVRYDLKDHGGVFGFEYLSGRLRELGFDFVKGSKWQGLADVSWNLPFVYVYERSDFSVSFFAFQIYPATIRKVLEEPSLSKSVTGKFTMMVKYDKNHNQFFEVNLELRHGIRQSGKLIKAAQAGIIKHLTVDNSEYRKTREEYPSKTVPKVVFWPYEHPLYFKPGTKQKWVKK